MPPSRHVIEQLVGKVQKRVDSTEGKHMGAWGGHGPAHNQSLPSSYVSTPPTNSPHEIITQEEQNFATAQETIALNMADFVLQDFQDKSHETSRTPSQGRQGFPLPSEGSSWNSSPDTAWAQPPSWSTSHYTSWGGVSSTLSSGGSSWGPPGVFDSAWSNPSNNSTTAWGGLDAYHRHQWDVSGLEPTLSDQSISSSRRDSSIASSIAGSSIASSRRDSTTSAISLDQYYGEHDSNILGLQTSETVIGDTDGSMAGSTYPASVDTNSPSATIDDGSKPCVQEPESVPLTKPVVQPGPIIIDISGSADATATEPPPQEKKEVPVEKVHKKNKKEKKLSAKKKRQAAKAAKRLAKQAAKQAKLEAKAQAIRKEKEDEEARTKGSLVCMSHMYEQDL